MSSDLGSLVEQNLLLKSLRPDDLDALRPHLDTLAYQRGQTIFSLGSEVTHITFPCGPMVASLVIATIDGRSAEAATIGREGAIGGAVSEGGLPASSHGLVQIGGPALRMDSARLQEVRRHSPAIDNLFTRYADCLLSQVLQSVACNALHPIEQRCLRSLMTLQDRFGSDELPLTQELLASMIGVQRTYLTRILRTLHEQDLIAIGRGRIRVLDRAKVSSAACECHDCIQRHYDTVMGAVYGGNGRLIAIDPQADQRRPRTRRVARSVEDVGG